MSESKFGVGDYVRIVGQGITASAYKNKGYEGRVTKVHEGNFDGVGRRGMDFWYHVGDEGVHEWELDLEFCNASEGKFKTKDSGKRVEFPSGMRRDADDSKPRYDLLDWPMLKRWAELMARGAVKYGEHNWKLASTEGEMNRFKSSAMRHLIQWFNGETDEDHAAAVFFNVGGAEMVKQKLNNEKVQEE